jgi:hypothetical protein
MAFTPKKKQPEFASLKTTLAQIKTSTDVALYQTLQLLIERLMQFQGLTLQDIADINDSINNILSIVSIVADKNRTYITFDDETLNLPNSYQLLPGTNITFDTTVPNQLTINADFPPPSAGNFYDSPLSDGSLTEAELIFANGECIIVQVPNP